MPRTRKHTKRKNFYLDENKIRRVQKLLGTRTETETIDKALDMALFRVDIQQSLQSAARSRGRIVEVF